MIEQLPGRIQRLIYEHLKQQNMGQNLLISGQAKSGKTTLTNYLTNQIPGDSNTVVVEDQPASGMPAINTDSTTIHNVTLFASPTGPPRRQLIKQVWRMRSDWIIQDEIGDAAEEHIRSGHVGHSTIATIQAADSIDAIEQFQKIAEQNLTDPETRAEQAARIGDNGYLILHLARPAGHRIPRICEVVRVLPKAGPAGYDLELLYRQV